MLNVQHDRRKNTINMRSKHSSCHYMDCGQAFLRSPMSFPGVRPMYTDIFNTYN